MGFIKNGSEYISGLIAEGIANGSRTATVTGNYEIDTAIRIPSSFTLLLEDCHLRMADGVFDNMFVNESHGTQKGTTPLGRDRGITIRGNGNAILDGGKYNGLSESTSKKCGMPHVSKNNLIIFTNTEDISISHIACHNSRWWAMNFIYCANGHIHDIDFKACDIGIDKNGNEYHGLIRARYEEVLVKNVDGIDLRQGCHDFLIENITGFNEDDTVALTNLNGDMERLYRVEGDSSDICNVTIRNIHASSYCSIVRLLNQGEFKLHDIHIEDIYDTSLTCPHLDHGRYAIRVGDADVMYGQRHSTEKETYNISIKGVRGRGMAVLHLAGAIGNLTIDDIASMREETSLIHDYRV